MINPKLFSGTLKVKSCKDCLELVGGRSILELSSCPQGNDARHNCKQRQIYEKNFAKEVEMSEFENGCLNDIRRVAPRTAKTAKVACDQSAAQDRQSWKLVATAYDNNDLGANENAGRIVKSGSDSPG